MRLLGFDISRRSKEIAVVEEKALPRTLSGIDANRGGWFRILESFAGAWQQNVEINFNSVLSYHAVYACTTLIASDISKLRVKLVERDSNGIWTETENPAYSPVLRKPNYYQTRIQFWESWILSKLLRGNTYVLKQRDKRGMVVALYVLDPNRVQTLVSNDGAVFYQLDADNLKGLGEFNEDSITVPAREIIHDRFNCLFHPLVGVSPIFACGLAATQGLNIQQNSAKFFKNLAVPSGLLLAPGAISDDTATRLKTHWETNYTSGAGLGKVAVLGDGLKFEPMTMTSVDAQLIEQLKWTAEVVCSTFHVPPYKIGVGTLPSFNNVQALNIEYYQQALQCLIESAELCLDEGLGMDTKTGTEFDLDGLLRMDSVTQMDVLERSKSVMTLDERRKKLDLKGIVGGATVYMQEQDHSIEAIAARDRQLIEQANNPAPPRLPAPDPEEDEDEEEAKGWLFAWALRKSLGLTLTTPEY